MNRTIGLPEGLNRDERRVWQRAYDIALEQSLEPGAGNIDPVATADKAVTDWNTGEPAEIKLVERSA